MPTGIVKRMREVEVEAIRCDGCHLEEELNQSHRDRMARRIPDGWMALTEGQQDQLTFCSWHCLLTYASHEHAKQRDRDEAQPVAV